MVVGDAAVRRIAALVPYASNASPALTAALLDRDGFQIAAIPLPMRDAVAGLDSTGRTTSYDWHGSLKLPCHAYGTAARWEILSRLAL